MAPFSECNDCIAKKWCKLYSGELKPTKNWCTSKFRLYRAMELSKIPINYFEANLFNYIGNEDKYRILKGVTDEILSNVDKGINYFFYGSSPGTGKTYSACVILNHFIYKACLTDRFDFENPLGLFVVYPDLMDDLRYRRDEERVQNALAELYSAPLLVLDDIGVGNCTDFTREQLYIILNRRKNSKLSTVFTSNLPISRLRDPEVLGARNVSRILADCMGLEFGGQDLRLRTVKGAK